MLKAPFPYFGGKSRVAHVVWQALGDVRHYVEPFFGSGAVLLARPEFKGSGLETVNDADGLLANLWRAIKWSPDAVAEHADWPVNEVDIHARQLWLLGERERITERLMGNPEWHDPKAAGWWVWGQSSHIGRSWCSEKGPWVTVDGVMVDSRKLEGIAPNIGITRSKPNLTGCPGIHCIDDIYSRMKRLSERLRKVNVVCGDWSRVCTKAVLSQRYVGVFLDPPYCQTLRDRRLYSVESGSAAHKCRQWAIEAGRNTRFRIVLAGLKGEHDELEEHGWTFYSWDRSGGMGRDRYNVDKERLWMSPHCNRESLLCDV